MFRLELSGEIVLERRRTFASAIGKQFLKLSWQSDYWVFLVLKTGRIEKSFLTDGLFVIYKENCSRGRNQTGRTQTFKIGPDCQSPVNVDRQATKFL